MKSLLIRLCICLSVMGVSIYSYLSLQNELTHLKVKLPQMEQELALIEEENQRLSYEVDQFENPSHLIELAHDPAYAHLKHPLLKEILTVPEIFASN